MDWTEDTGDDTFVLMRTKKNKTASTSDEQWDHAELRRIRSCSFRRRIIDDLTIVLYPITSAQRRCDEDKVDGPLRSNHYFSNMAASEGP